MNILIEGDNGTGKDTLAMAFQPQFDIITYHNEIQQKMDFARTFKGFAQTLKFLEYNASCGRVMEGYAKSGIDSITIRYWPSTITAAYADGKLTEAECDLLVGVCMAMFAMPDLVIFLVCDHNERIRRIVLRNSPHFDDKSVKRAKRYAYYSEKIMNRLGGIVHRVTTNGRTRENIQDEVREIINQGVPYERAG